MCLRSFDKDFYNLLMLLICVITLFFSKYISILGSRRGTHNFSTKDPVYFTAADTFDYMSACSLQDDNWPYTEITGKYK